MWLNTARADRLRRLRDMVPPVGLSVAVTGTAWAGARRTGSACPGYLAATRAGHVLTVVLRSE